MLLRSTVYCKSDPKYDRAMRTKHSTFRFLQVIACVVISPGLLSGGEPDYQRDVTPILTAKCGKCHGAETQEGDVRFDELTTDFSNRAAAHTWREARNAINAAEMPPEDETPLTTEERETVLAWITNSLRQEIERQKDTGGRVVLRRLNRTEYQNTMQDLLGIEMNYTRDLPPDGVSSDGFRNDGRALRMSAIHLEYYLDTARRAMERVIVHGPPPRVFRHKFEKSNVGGWRGPTEKSNRLERAQKFLAKMVNDYPESGEFVVRVQTRAILRENKGFPILECAVGYRPDTEVYFAIAGMREIVSEDLQQIVFRGRLENFPLPVRGQGKYPGLVVRLRNVYDDGTPMPTKLEEITRNGRKVKAFREELTLPHLDIQNVEFEGPVFAQWPPAHHRRILFESELRDSNEAEYIRQVLERFMTRAFRRQPTDREVEDMFAFFASIRPHYTRFEDAIRETLAMVLVQPDFLFQMEPGGDEKRPIGDFELATRLSYFLWSTMPDDRLFALAKQNLLHEPAVLQGEVERLLKDERSKRLSNQFTRQWLRLGGVETVTISRDDYPNFKDSLKPHLIAETTGMFRELLRANENALLLLDSDFTMLNEPLARHYSIPEVYGQKLRRVPLPKTTKRGGILGHASILLANSSGRDSHPIRRAVWIRDRLLGDPPAPPPPDVPELDEANPEFAKLSVREQLEVHRNRDSCASCHRGLDPWGISLEHFDAVGLWRDHIVKKHNGAEEKRPVNAVDELPNGTRFDGAESLRRYLVKEKGDEFGETLVRHLMTYALGRSLELTDEDEIADLTKEFMKDDYRLRSLVHRIVSSEAFNTK